MTVHCPFRNQHVGSHVSSRWVEAYRNEPLLVCLEVGIAPAGRRHKVFANQGLLAIAFFEVTALIVLLVLFLLLWRDHPDGYFRLWLTGWVSLTVSSVFELGLAAQEGPEVRLVALATQVIALLLFLSSAMRLTVGGISRNWPVLPLATAILAGVYYVERSTSAPYFGKIHWETAALESIISLSAGGMLWRATAKHKGHSGRAL